MAEEYQKDLDYPVQRSSIAWQSRLRDVYPLLVNVGKVYLERRKIRLTTPVRDSLKQVASQIQKTWKQEVVRKHQSSKLFNGFEQLLAELADFWYGKQHPRSVR